MSEAAATEAAGQGSLIDGATTLPAEARAESPEQIGQKARGLLTAKAKEIFAKPEGGERAPDMANPREAALRMIQQISDPDSQPNFNFGKDKGPNDIILTEYDEPDGKFSIRDGRLLGIKGGTKDTVACDFLDVDGNVQTINVPRTQMVDNVLGAYHKDLIDAFDGDDQATLKAHLTNMGVDDSADPSERRLKEDQTAAQRVLKNQREEIQKVIDKLKAAATNPAELESSERYKELLRLNAELENAEFAGGEFGVLLQKRALEMVKTRDSVAQFEVQQVLKQDSEFSKQVQDAEQKAKDFFDGKTAIPEDRRKQYAEALKDPAAFCDLLLGDESFAELSSDVLEKIYGDLDEDRINTLVQNIINTSGGLDSGKEDKITKLKTYSKRAGIIALILAAMPVAAAAIAAAAAASAAGEGLKRAR